MKFWHLAIGLGFGFLLFMAIFTSENQKILMESESKSPLQTQVLLPDIIEKKDEVQYFYTPENQFFLLKNLAEIQKNEKNFLIQSGEVFLAGGLTENNPETIQVLAASFDARDKEVLINVDEKKSLAEIYAINGSLSVRFPSSEYFLIVPVGYKATIPNDVFFLQQPNAFLRSDLNAFFQVKPWIDTSKSVEIEEARSMYASWVNQFENSSQQFPFLWSNGKKISLAARIGTLMARIHQEYSVGLSSYKKQNAHLSEAMSYVVDSLTFFQRADQPRLEKSLTEAHEFINGSTWQRFLENPSDQATRWNDYKVGFGFWIRSQYQTSPERALWGMFSPLKNSKISIMERHWDDAEKNLARLFLQKTEKNLLSLKQVLDTYRFGQEDLDFLETKRYLLARLLTEYSFFQKPEFFDLYDSLAQQKIRLQSGEHQVENLQIAQEIVDLVQVITQRNTDPKISEILLGLWDRLNINKLELEISLEVIKPESKILINNLRISGGQKIDADEVKSIAETLQFERELEDQIAKYESSLQIDIPGSNQDDHLVDSAPELLSFFKKYLVKIDLLHFKTSRETGSTSFEKFTYKDRFISGEFEYDSQRFLFLELSSGESYKLVSRDRFKDILKTIDIAIEEELKRIDALEKKEQALLDNYEIRLPIPESEVIQTNEKAVLARRFAQRMLTALPLNLQRNNIMVLDDSYQIFGVWDAASGRIEKIGFRFDQINGNFSNIKWIETPEDSKESMLFEKELVMSWDEFNEWLLSFKVLDKKDENKPVTTNQ